jgi:uncharacterized protein
MLALELVAVGAAGAAAGAANALAGAGSLITFPTMVALGVPQLAANVTSTVGLIPGAVGGSLGYADLLADQRRRLARLLVPSLTAAAGTALLLLAPAGAFEAVVPADRRVLGAFAAPAAARRPDATGSCLPGS